MTNYSANSISVLTAGGDNSSQTFSGALLDGYGMLGLVKAGTGSLTLSGSSIYSGGTTVSGGTLQLGNGTTKNGSVAGDILNNSTLVFANPALQVYTGAISGGGSLIKNGPGTLQLTATHTYTGPTVINAGTVQLGYPVTVSGFGADTTGGTGTAAAVNDRQRHVDVQQLLLRLRLQPDASDWRIAQSDRRLVVQCHGPSSGHVRHRGSPQRLVQYARTRQ